MSLTEGHSYLQVIFQGKRRGLWWPPGREPKDDPRVEAIAQAARELVEKRDRWLNPEGVIEEGLKKRTLTNLYSFVLSELERGGSRLINPQSAIRNWYRMPTAGLTT